MSETPSNPKLAAAENYQKTVVTYSTGPLTAYLLERAQPQPGEHVVDVACGTGVVARQAAPRVGTTGAIVAVDINPAMLAVGRSLPSPEGASIDWREGSVQALPLPDNSFDLVLCQQGLQFFPDRPVAVREMYRVLRPGGRLAATVTRSLEHNPASQLIWETIARHLKTTPGALTPTFSLGDAGELRALLESAGFRDVTVTVCSFTVREPWTEHLVARTLSAVAAVVPNLAALIEREGATLTQAIDAELAPALQQFVEGNEQLYPVSLHIALAHKL